MEQEKRFAVLIDADNVSERYIKGILNEITNDGVATYKRIYGDWTLPNLGAWKNVLLRYSIQPIQQYGYTQGKNATDSAMIIDAMDILYTGQVDGFCIVSSDSDFTRLAVRLREAGKTVIGMGEKKTPKPFIAACNRFKYLEILVAEEERPLDAPHLPEEAAAPEAPCEQPRAAVRREAARKSASRPAPEKAARETGPQTGEETIRTALHAIVQENSDENGWIEISRIGTLLVKRYPDFDVRNFGHSKLSLFLESLDLLESARQNNIVRVRLQEGAKKLPSHPTAKTVRRAVRTIVDQSVDPGVWLRANEIGRQLSARYPGFDLSQLGYDRFIDFLETVEGLECRYAGSDNRLVARLTARGTAGA